MFVHVCPNLKKKKKITSGQDDAGGPIFYFQFSALFIHMNGKGYKSTKNYKENSEIVKASWISELN